MILNMAAGGGNVSVVIDGHSFEGALTLSTHYMEPILKTAPSNSYNVVACAIFDNKLWVFLNNSSHWVYSTEDGSTWTSELSSTNGTVSKAFVFNNNLYIVVGTDIYRYDTTAWTKVTTVPSIDGHTSVSIRIGTVAVYDGAVHFALGWQESTSNYNFRYHYKWDGTTWTSVSTLPVQGFYSNFIVLNNQLYLLIGSSTELNSFYRWSGSSWTSLGSISPYPQSAEFIAFYKTVDSIGEKIHLIFNYTPSGGSLTVAHRVYDGTSWSDGQDLSVLPSSYNIMCGICFNNAESHIFNGNHQHLAFGLEYYLREV